MESVRFAIGLWHFVTWSSLFLWLFFLTITNRVSFLYHHVSPVMMLQYGTCLGIPRGTLTSTDKYVHLYVPYNGLKRFIKDNRKHYKHHIIDVESSMMHLKTIIYVRVLETFPGPGYLCSEDGVVWLWHLLVNLYIWLTISSCYDSIPLILGLIGRDGGLSILCHGCRFACQQSVLKTFPGPGHLRSEDGAVWLWHLLVNL